LASGDRELAEEAVERVLVLDPNNPGAIALREKVRVQ
jgi:hypothetical protein